MIAGDAAPGACGVREEDGAVFRLEQSGDPVPQASWDPGFDVKANPFAWSETFRACTQDEIDATNCWPEEEAAVQQVTFRVTNSSESDLYLVVSGDGCTPFSIDAVPDSSALPQAVDEPCPCGHACDYLKYGDVQRLVPGATHDLIWDARQVQLVQQTVVCEQGPTPPESFATHGLAGVPHPAPPQSYRATIGYYLNDDGYYPTPTSTGPVVQPRCSSDGYVVTGFELVNGEDVLVPVSIP